MTEADDNICPECPHDLEDHTLEEDSGLLECDICNCSIDPAEHGVEILDEDEDEDDDDYDGLPDDEDEEDDDDYDDEDSDKEPAAPARGFPEPAPA